MKKFLLSLGKGTHSSVSHSLQRSPALQARRVARISGRQVAGLPSRLRSIPGWTQDTSSSRRRQQQSAAEAAGGGGGRQEAAPADGGGSSREMLWGAGRGQWVAAAALRWQCMAAVSGM